MRARKSRDLNYLLQDMQEAVTWKNRPPCTLFAEYFDLLMPAWCGYNIAQHTIVHCANVINHKYSILHTGKHCQLQNHQRHPSALGGVLYFLFRTHVCVRGRSLLPPRETPKRGRSLPGGGGTCAQRWPLLETFFESFFLQGT